ncbi:VOC family protein [uncultured Jatrophihabitans sp.]|uniref:VOC family protein n=1 Tax=uncultured Jatrophihabitans sp. TaxID=1610747 RepID=UPI0035C9CE2A
MRLDHLSYAAGPEGLAACAQRLGSRLGAGFRDGGIHPSFGTRNFVLPLEHGCYLEVVEALDHPAADRAPFGRAVRARGESGGGWLAWAVAVDDISVIEQRLGRTAARGHRRRPDGFDLLWRQIGINDVSEDPQLPFFTAWESDPEHHPSHGGSDIELQSLEIAGDEPTVDAYLGESSREPLDGVDVEWSAPDDGDTGLIAATFNTPRGRVRLD